MRGRMALGLVLPLLAGALGEARADPPELASWLLNTSGLTGYNNLSANVQRVRFSTSYVYVNCSGIPSYTIGPWPGNPNTPSDQGYLFKVPRAPVVNAGTPTATPLGPIAVWTNGVAVFNALDAHSYNNQNVWHQNAVVVEGPSFDACLGHPAPGGRYHHHQNPRCLYGAETRRHSPVLGYAFDGFPIYGPYAYTQPDGSGGIGRLRSSYRLRNITQRTTLPDGTVLPPSQYGPPVSSTYPLGYYVEDYEFVNGLGDLDASNGRSAVTPEYPAGTYAYFVTVDESGASAYPYAIGPRYHGVVSMENISSGGHVSLGEPVTDYVPTGPGEVPPSVMAARVSPTQISLDWNVSCAAAGASDYGVYEGAIGSWYGHSLVTCTDSSHDLREVVAASEGDRYYLVVPQGAGREGSYGRASDGTERPAGTAACAAVQEVGGCP